MKPEYLKRDDIDFCAAHVAEECGEMLAAIGKSLRWGFDSVNPELPPSEQESNLDWYRRESADLRSALDRLLDAALASRYGTRP